MTIYKQRDIVLITFPFSDLTGQKVRPVLILSNDIYNQQSLDLLVCGITANIKSAPYSIIVDVTDVEQAGTLRNKSKIRVGPFPICRSLNKLPCRRENFLFPSP